MNSQVKVWMVRFFCSIWRFGSLRIGRVFFGQSSPGSFVERPLFGFRFQVDPSRSDTQRVLLVEGKRVIEEWRLVRELVQGKSCLVDVGANIGYYALLFQRYAAEGAEVHCIEPSEENLPELERNIEINKFSNIHLHKVAVGDQEGVVGLKRGINSGIATADEGSYEVPIMPLDQVVTEDVDFLKIDVEGYEYNVLKGAESIIQKNRPSLFVELHPKTLHRFGSSVQECVEFLGEYYDQIEFYVGANSLDRQSSFFGKLIGRTIQVYLGRGLIKKVNLSGADLKDIDARDPWGTFWAVCR